MSCTCFLLINFRLTLSALHFNENSAQDQATTASNEECFEILYPKYKKGGHIVRKILVDPTYSKLLITFNFVDILYTLLQIMSKNS